MHEPDDEEVWVVRAAELAQAQQRPGFTGSLEERLLSLTAAWKRSTGAQRVLVQIEYPGEPTGGIRLRCRRWTWLARLVWRFASPVQGDV